MKVDKVFRAITLVVGLALIGSVVFNSVVHGASKDEIVIR